ncbi:MAG: Asp-tRNA(Asn)/Glu-tRNA(Gln) amidotransferase subunit GatA [Angelakisella sp.]
MKLFEYSAVELHQKLITKQCSATEVAQSALDRIAETDGAVGAYLTVTADAALKNAAAVDKKIATGETISPLAGIPVAVKDNICTQDITTTCASKMLEHFVPPYNATVVERMHSANMTITGKVNMDEFAMGSSCENSYFQPTKNPRDLTRVPGGSSGGSAAAVAAGQAVVSLGSDTGGSIRQPASCCGILGLKPTYGSVSRYGLVAFASSLDQIGPFGRCVTDVANLYSVLCGADKMDATSARREYPDFGALLNADVTGLRIGIPKEYFGDGVEGEVKTLVHQALTELEARGATLTEVSLPSTDYALSAYYVLSSAEASSNLARFDGVKYGYRAPQFDGLTDMYERTRSEGFGDEVKRRIMLGTFVLSSGYYDAYYNKAKRMQNVIAAEFAAAFAQCDLLATPTMPTTAFRLGENVGNPLKMYASDICTVTVNIAGLPAISLPCGQMNGLPVGMQLIGPKFSEQRILNTSYALEQLRGGLCSTATL